MFRGVAWAVLLLVLLVVASPVARAASPPNAGAVIVAVGDDATDAAEALARTVYRDPALRPAIDETTARVLTGKPLPEHPSPELTDLAELRRSLATAGNDAAARRLLAGIGAEVHAQLVVAVRGGERPTARVLRVDSAAFAGVELTAAPSQAGEAARFPDAVATLKSLLPAPPPRVAPAREPAPPKKADSGDKKSALSSPWFWAGLGAVLTIGVTTFVVGRGIETSSDSVHLQGRVAP